MTFLEKLYKFGFMSGKTSEEGKPENINFLFCIEIDIPFTRILININSALNGSFSPSNHILSLTFFHDFDTFLNTKQYFFTSTPGR
jgi:hypothetical protein